MSSIAFESNMTSCPTTSMLLDSNKRSTCAASVTNSMLYNNNAIFTPSHQQQNTSSLIYTNMACNPVGDSSTTSNVSSSHATRLQQFDNNDAPNLDTMYNPAKNVPMDHRRAEELDDLAPMTRDRSNTWPLRRPTVETQTSPIIHEQIPEEDSLYGSEEHLDTQKQPIVQQHQTSPSQHFNLTFNNNQVHCEEDTGEQFAVEDSSPGGDEHNSSEGSKKSATRRNAWGNLSYADLITQAILSSPDQRLTLSQIYEWMTRNVEYFAGKGDSNSSAGWKNSIRHNLSLHNRFMRIQNEGAGKSSWWQINPDAKPGRNPRRRATTMETTTKAAIEKKRRGARKRVEMLRNSTQGGLNDSVGGSQLSMTSQDPYNEDDSLGANFEHFRARTQSNVSSILGGNSSPQQFEDFDYPPWANTSQNPIGTQLGPNVNELLDRTDQMRLDNGENPEAMQQRKSPLQMTIIKQEDIKQETGMQPPPSYQEVIQSQNQMRPIMHSQPAPMMQNKIIPNNVNAQQNFYQTNIYSGIPSQMISQRSINSQPPMTSQSSMSSQSQQWVQMQQPQMIYNQQQFGGGSMLSNSGGMVMGIGRMDQQLPPIADLSQLELPNDLINLANLDSRFMDTDVESILRTL